MLLANVNVLLFVTFFSGCLSQDEYVIVQIPDGLVRGRAEVTVTNTTFYSFKGIPYAAPPVGELRFQAPQPVQPWDDILDATREKNVCYQVRTDRDDESEDCLFINVFVPRNPASNQPLPVMFFIHGGGFIEGSSESSMFGPQHFMEYDVIIVSFNYRLGPFGFASTGDDLIPGNAGLKDQNFALQWVQKNVQYFGGDPEKVTIFGASAGAASVAYQILSPKSEGLFRAAISESGTALSPWTYQRNQVEITSLTALFIDPIFAGINVTASAVHELLLNVSAKQIDVASSLMYIVDQQGYYQMRQGIFYAPVIEHEHEGAFITKLQYEALQSGEFNRVPLIIGFNSEESVTMMADEGDVNSMAQSFDSSPLQLIPLDMHIQDEEEAAARTAQSIKELYVSNGTFAENPLQALKYYSDQSFTRSIIKHAQLQSQYTDVYLYQFAYGGVMGGNSEPVEGFFDSVGHGTEVFYLFAVNSDGLPNTTDLSKYPESDVLVHRRLITLFTNFAKYLNPTPTESELLENIIWPKVDAENIPYLDIGSYSLVKTHPRNETYGEWEKIYGEAGVPPYDTY